MVLGCGGGDAPAGTDSGVARDLGSDADSDSGTGTDSGADIDSGNDTDSGIATDSGTATDSGGATDSGIDCSTIGCGAPVVCGVACDAPCGCCPCADGEVVTLDGASYVCSGGCYAPNP